MYTDESVERTPLSFNIDYVGQYEDGSNIHITSEKFTDDGVEETQWTLDAGNGMKATLSSFGATLTKLIIED